MSQLFEQIRLDHVHIAQLLDILDHQLNILSEAGGADFELICDIIRYMTTYPDTVHHPREGLMFERLLAHDASAADLLRDLTTEHRLLAEKGAACMEIMRQVIDGAMVRRDQIEALGREYVALLRAHMDKEDTDAFPRLEKNLTDEDWRALDASLDPQDDPVFGPQVEAQFDSLLTFIHQHSADRHPPPEDL